MIYNYILTSFRNLKKRWRYTLINVLGLSLGLTCFLLLFGYTSYEESFEDFHQNIDNIHLIEMYRYNDEHVESISPNVMPALGFNLKDEISGVKYLTRFFGDGAENFVRNDVVSASESKVFLADNDFFKIFNYEFILGSSEEALSAPLNIVITERVAKKYFSNKNPLGKQLQVGNRLGNDKYTITGVVKDLPLNTKIKFDFLCSITSLHHGKNWIQKDWVWWAFPTFITLEDEIKTSDIESQFPSYIKKHKTEKNDANRTWEFKLKPLKKLHLNSNYRDKGANLNKEAKKLNLFKFIALLIILISWINYINLSTATANERAKEVGVRKAIGASKKQIIIQFIIETILINLLAGTLAVLLLFITINPFALILNLHYINDVLNQIDIWKYLIFILSISVLISGVYPALIMSSFKPLAVLKSKTLNNTSNSTFRKILIGVQYCISIGLISSTIIIIHQNEFVKSKDLGVKISDKLVFRRPMFVKESDYQKRYESFRDRLKNEIKGISNATASFSIPSKQSLGLAAWQHTKGVDSQTLHIINAVDENYITSYGLQLVAGNNFKKFNNGNKRQVILSEKSSSDLGFSSPKEAIGKKLGLEVYNNIIFTVVGVIKDYNFISPQYTERGIIFTRPLWFTKAPKYISLKLNQQLEFNTVKSEVKAIFKEVFPGNNYDTMILENEFLKIYENENRNQSIFSMFTSLAIFLACIGVLGLVSFIALLKTKELGLRKLFGASIKDLTWVLSKEFITIFISAVVIVIPIIFYYMKQWLEGYPYRISLNFWHFGIPIIVVGGITFLIICFNLFKVLKNNPVNSLEV